MKVSFLTRSTGETERIGRLLGSVLSPGSLVLLEGDLGTGKTTAVRGLVSGLGGKGVKSPSFTLINEYSGAVSVAHADLYRLEEVDFRSMGLDEYIDDGWIVVIEWPDRLTSPAPAKGIKVILEHVDLVRCSDEGTRRVTLIPLDEPTRSRLAAMDLSSWGDVL